MAQTDTRARLADALGWSVLEIDDLVSLAADVEAALGRLAASMPSPDVQALIDCQAADLLAQRLLGLRGFVGSLAAQAPEAARVDLALATRGLGLDQQARRLSGEPSTTVADEPVLLFAD